MTDTRNLRKIMTLLCKRMPSNCEFNLDLWCHNNERMDVLEITLYQTKTMNKYTKFEIRESRRDKVMVNILCENPDRDMYSGYGYFWILYKTDLLTPNEVVEMILDTYEEEI